MPRIRRLQSSFNAGVLDPRLAARIDVKAYYSGAEALDNAICIPQGGVARRPGLEYIDTCHNQITRVVSGITITTPNGGTGANANDEDESTYLLTTTNIGVINPYVVVHYDLGSAKEIHYVDVTLFSITTSTNDEFEVQYSTDNVSWTTAYQFDVSPTEASYRQDVEATARYWRIARIGTTDLGVERAKVAEFELWENGGAISEARLIPFSFNTEQTYLLVATDQNIQVYKDDVVIASIHIPHTSAQLPELNWTQSADTLILVHPDVAPLEVVRNTAAEGIWTTNNMAITNIPQYDYGSGAENVWSITRGWPRTVTFFQGRMVFGGSKSRPQGIWLSVANDFYNFDVGTALDDEAIVGTLDTDQVNEIRNVVPGRKLEIYTSGGEFVVPTSPATPSNFSVVRQTKFGSLPIQTASIDGSTLFAQRSGKGFREFLYSFSEDAHVSNSVSQLSTHLINTPVDLDAVAGASGTETNYVYLVNTDGTVVVLNTLREQEIAAWSGPWSTLNGNFKQVGVLDYDTYFIVRRTINGTDYNYVEKLNDSYYTDSGVQIASHSSATVTGLDHLEGETVKVKLGGAVQTDATVSSGSITLSRTPSAEAVEVGLHYAPTITTMPVSDGYQDGPTLNRDKRIVKVVLNRYQSLGIIVNGEKLPDRQLDADTFDAVPSPSDELTEIYLNGWSQNAQVTITQEDPVPMTILGIDLEVSA